VATPGFTGIGLVSVRKSKNPVRRLSQKTTYYEEIPKKGLGLPRSRVSAKKGKESWVDKKKPPRDKKEFVNEENENGGVETGENKGLRYVKRQGGESSREDRRRGVSLDADEDRLIRGGRDGLSVPRARKSLGGTCTARRPQIQGTETRRMEKKGGS